MWFHAQVAQKKFASVVKLAMVTYVYHSTKIAKAGPGYDVQPEHPPVQINSSSPCSITHALT